MRVIPNDPRMTDSMPAERCAYWLNGKQCPCRRTTGSIFCALHRAGRFV
jgi:hypothetical protein